MAQNEGMPLNTGGQLSTTACPNCHLPMPTELRFCRNCGYRLGEGSPEYTETVRFHPDQNGTQAQQVYATTYGLGGTPVARPNTQVKPRRRMSGMTWMFLGLLIFFIAAAGFTAIVTPIRRSINAGVTAPAAPRAYFGVSPFENAEGGVTFENVEPPGSPADKAGLVGGDIITSFDGRTVSTENELSDLLRATPIGKTVDISYIRDGEPATTKLTVISKQDLDRLNQEFRRRPEGRGQFGYDDDSAERVQAPGMTIYGVRLNRISQSRAADLAGVKQGDIVIDIDGVPIRTPEEFLARVGRAVPYSTIKLLVIRDGEKLEIPVKMGKQ